MFTRNHYVAMRIAILKKGGDVIPTHGDTESTGDSATLTTSYKQAMITKYSSSYGLFLGTGTTPATIDDYKPESAITSGLTLTMPSAVTVSQTADGEEWTVTIGVTASSAVTISEIGVIGQLSYSAMTRNVLFERTVLETPIVLAAGESKQIVYTIRFNFATA